MLVLLLPPLLDDPPSLLEDEPPLFDDPSLFDEPFDDPSLFDDEEPLLPDDDDDPLLPDDDDEPDPLSVHAVSDNTMTAMTAISARRTAPTYQTVAA